MPRSRYRRILAILAIVLVALVLAAAGTAPIIDGGGGDNGAGYDGPYSEAHFGW